MQASAFLAAARRPDQVPETGSERRVAQPADERTTKIHETFVPLATPAVPASAAAWQTQRDAWRQALREKSFGGWPDTAEPLALARADRRTVAHADGAADGRADDEAADDEQAVVCADAHADACAELEPNEGPDRPSHERAFFRPVAHADGPADGAADGTADACPQMVSRKLLH
jgi:hypothetical protein